MVSSGNARTQHRHPIRFFERELSSSKRFRDGTHRARPPKETLARARRLARRVGVTRLAHLTGLDELGIPVYSAIRPNGRSLSTSQGKGLDHAAAAVSALMESLETWHAEHMTLPVVRGSYRELAARGAVDPRTLPHAGRARATLGARLEWVRGWDLARAAPVLVPRESVTLDCVFPRRRAPLFDVSSNGLASGNHLLEAIVHGLCEVIERDAEARWRAARGQRRVALDAVRDPACRALLDRFAAAGAHAAVWDITSDVGVPAYGCALIEDPRRPSWRALGLYQGFGCHLAPEVALARALCEAAQTRVTYVAGSRDDFFPFDYERATDAELLEQIWDELAAPPDERVRLADAPCLAGATFEDDVRTLVERLTAAGAREVIAVDLTRPELALPVVKVLVPGRAVDVELMG
jgi:ribosomal protein S12 methylthiotransferase accessory factor